MQMTDFLKQSIDESFDFETSNEFSVPTFPEPSFVISNDLNFLRIIYAVGMEPSIIPIKIPTK